MRQPMTISFPGMKPNRTIEAEIRKRAAKLDALCPGIISCHIVADIPHRHHQHGNHFRLRIDLKVRREEIAVARDGPQKDLRLVLKQAFDVATRRLQEHIRQRRDGRRRVAASRRLPLKSKSAA